MLFTNNRDNLGIRKALAGTLVFNSFHSMKVIICYGNDFNIPKTILKFYIRYWSIEMFSLCCKWRFPSTLSYLFCVLFIKKIQFIRITYFPLCFTKCMKFFETFISKLYSLKTYILLGHVKSIKYKLNKFRRT